jgi:hypothetical protein
MCHCKNGDGKGDVAADLKLKMRDESEPATLKDLCDGALFYILTKGKDQMPPEAGRGKDEGIWDIVELRAVVLEERGRQRRANPRKRRRRTRHRVSGSSRVRSPGYTGQTTETLALPTDPVPFEQVVGVP